MQSQILCQSACSTYVSALPSNSAIATLLPTGVFRLGLKVLLSLCIATKSGPVHVGRSMLKAEGKLGHLPSPNKLAIFKVRPSYA